MDVSIWAKLAIAWAYKIAIYFVFAFLVACLIKKTINVSANVWELTLLVLTVKLFLRFHIGIQVK